MNVYSELLELLSPRRAGSGAAALCGTIAAVSPLTVSVRGTEVSQGLAALYGARFTEQDVGAEVALLPMETGLLVLGRLEGGSGG